MDLRQGHFFLVHSCAIIPGTDESVAEADYELELDKIYFLVVKSLATTSLNFLVQVQSTADGLSRSDVVASWIPRWDSSIKEAPTAFWEAWDASLRISKQLHYPVNVSEKQPHVSALLFDTVASQTDIMEKPRF